MTSPPLFPDIVVFSRPGLFHIWQPYRALVVSDWAACVQQLYVGELSPILYTDGGSLYRILEQGAELATNTISARDEG